MVLPRISVITPSYNQARFLERTLRSVLDQEYPELEYILIDGGSTDGSVEILRNYSKQLAYWVSEPDRGQANAINKGFRLATGEWVAWQNSDDVYFPGAFASLVRCAMLHPEASLITGNMTLIDADDRPIRQMRYIRPSYEALRAEGMILTNQAAFWKRSVHKEIGFLNESLTCAFDYEWFLRVTERFESRHVNETWGGLRIHDATKSQQQAAMFSSEMEVVRRQRPFPRWKTPLYRIRRAILMVIQGDWRYVLNGFFDRIESLLTVRTRRT